MLQGVVGAACKKGRAGMFWHLTMVLAAALVLVVFCDINGLVNDSFLLGQPRVPSFDDWVVFPGMDDETRDVVDAIRRHQNPIDCSLAKYYIFPPRNYGMSGDLRFYSWILWGAFHQDRVVVFPPTYRTEEDKWLWTDPSYCANDTLSPDCYFEPYSRCQSYVTEEMALAAPQVYDAWVDSTEPVVWLDPDAWFTAKHWPIEQLPHSTDEYGQPKSHIDWMYPKEMRYVARPNARTRAWAYRFLKDSLYRFEARTRTERRVYPEAPPERAVCAHIRASDKAAEMALHPVSEYLEAAEEYRKQFDAPHVFVTTESLSVIEELLSPNVSAMYPHMTFYFTKYNRSRNESLSVMEMAGQTGRSYMALASLANLYLGAHPSCVAFVETLASNWCSLINDIRVTDNLNRSEPWRLRNFEQTFYGRRLMTNMK